MDTRMKSCPSLNPPAHRHDDSDDPETHRPPFVLLEPFAYFADRDNATTASCHINAIDDDDPELGPEGCIVKVTFCAAHPPGVSYLCVHAVGLGDPLHRPLILATETDGSLLLLSIPIPIPGTPDHASIPVLREEYLVYDARAPSLAHLPHPLPSCRRPSLVVNTVAIMRNCRRQCQCHGTSAADDDDHDCGYVIAAQSGGFGCDDDHDQIHLYRSDAGEWTVPRMVIDPPIDEDYYMTHKTIAITGGTVGWVDLASTIILCDVLDDRPTVRYLPLPPPVRPDSDDDASRRDIAVLGSSIKYVDMQFLHGHGWKATVWSIDGVCAGLSSPEGWRVEYELNSWELQGGSTAPYIGLPRLSLQEDGVVYFLTVVDYRERSHPAWVLAVDMRSKKVLEVAEVGTTRTITLFLGYDASRISKYLKIASCT